MGTKHPGTPKEVRALNAYIALSRAWGSLNAAVGGHIREAGLTDTQFGVLEALYHLGPLCQKDLGAKLLTSGANITVVVDNLERRGLAARRRDSRDRRLVSVEPTAKGRALIAGLFPAHAKRLARAFEALTASEQDTLRLLCRNLGKSQEAT